MPRNGSGTATRVTPPGASGYVTGNDILPSEVNGEINDIYTELTNSIDKAGRTTPTANLPMGGFKLSGLGAGSAAGESVRFNLFQQGSDISVTSSGSVTIASEGSLFNLTAASAFNVTGFSSNYNGRTFAVRFNPDKLLTLVHSSTFKLRGNTNRITMAGEIAYFVQESGGSITEVSDQPILDLSSYSGADITIGINQKAKYDVSAATSLLLRIATNGGTYNLYLDRDAIAGGAAVTSTYLNPNNTTLGASAVHREWSVAANATAQTADSTSENAFALSGGGTLQNSEARIVTRTTGKHVVIRVAKSLTTTTHNVVTGSEEWTNDTATVWSSLGTIVWPAAWTGTVTVERIM